MRHVGGAGVGGTGEPAVEAGQERDGELTALHDAVRAAAGGTGAVVVVQGSPGVGKTTLLEYACAHARSAGLRVLAGRGRELERTIGLGVAVDLLAPAVLAAAPSERDRLLGGRAAAAAPLLLDPSGEPATPADTALRGLCWVAANLAGWDERPPRSAPVLIAIDDVQWVDAPSLRFLAMLADRADRMPLSLLLTVRDGVDAEMLTDTAALRLLITHPRARLLSPAPLTPAAVAKLTAAAFPASGPDLAAAVAHAGGGNPFLTIQLLRALDERDASDPAAVADLVPAGVLRSIVARLGQLPEPATRLASSLAVLGDGTPLRQAAAHAALAVVAAERSADQLARAHLVRPGNPIAFSHPLIRVAIYTDLPGFARARAHRRAADLIAADGGSLDKVAGHLLAAEPEGDAGSVEVLATAARRTLRRGDPAAATRLLRRALAEPPPPADRARLLTELARAHLTGGDPAAREALAEALGLLGRDEVHARAEVLAAQSRMYHARGELDRAAAAGGQALDLLDPRDPAWQDTLAGYLAVATFHAPLRPDADRRLAPMLDQTRRGRPPQRSALLAYVTLHLALDGDPPAAVCVLAARALAADPLVDPTDHGTLFALVAHALVIAGDWRAAESACVAALDVARRRSDYLALSSGAYHRALARHRRGALTMALADLEASRVDPEAGWRGGTAWTNALAVQIHLDLGNGAAARDALRQADPPPPGAMDGALLGLARARLALADHDPGTALAEAHAAGAYLSDAFGIDHPGLLPWRIPAALAAHHLGDHEQAGRLAAAALDRARQIQQPAAIGTALRITGLVARPGPDTAVLAEAVQTLQPTGAALDHARALTELGAALRRSGRPAAARHPLREGLAVADQLRAAPLAARARAELSATGARPRRTAVTGINALTPAEQRVALLALHGDDNATIAQTIFITTKTVETHLSRTYRKLGITGRRQLHDVFDDDYPQ